MFLFNSTSNRQNMKKFRLIFVISSIVHLFAIFHVASATVNLDTITREIEISKSVSLIKTVKDFDLKKLSSLEFIPNNEKTLHLGYNDGRSLIKFTLINDSDKKLERYIYLNTINGLLELYQVNPDHSLVYLIRGGTDLPKLKRAHSGIFGALPIFLPPLTKVTYLLSISSRHNVNSNIYVGDRDSLNERESTRLGFLGFYSGGIILLVLYNFFLFFMLKERVYLLYCLYASSFMLSALVIAGQLDHFFPLSTFTFSHYLICFSSISLITATLFTLHFLEVKKFYPRMVKIFYGYLSIPAVIFISGFFTFFERYSRFFGLAIDLAILSALILFIVTAIKLYTKLPVAKFYLMSWILVLASVVCWFGMTFGFLKINIFTQNILAIGSMLEMLMLSFALAYKIEVLNQEKISALERAKDKDRYARLVRVLSHDVANSLTVVSSYSKKLTKNNNLDEVSQNYVAKIFRGTENIKNILQIVRQQETQVKTNQLLDLVPINVKECIEFSRTLHEEALQLKQINVQAIIPSDLYILADKTCFINNIVNNILSNAIKFSYPGSSIEIYSTDSTDFTNIHFKDYGVGIKRNILDDIFHSSQIITSKGTNDEYGHGLGSNLIREYMLLFGGKILVTSVAKEETTAEHGTLIKLMFPKS